MNSNMPGWDNRDPYFLVAGKEVNGTIYWSQPELMLYIIPPCADARCGIGYPDFVEIESVADPNWQIYLSETDKVASRLHALDMRMLALMWNQTLADEVAPGPDLVWGDDAPLPIEAPSFGDISSGAGFTIELGGLEWDELDKKAVGAPVLDCRTSDGVGVAVLVGRKDGAITLNISFCDQLQKCQFWDTDADAAPSSSNRSTTLAHATFLVDGASRTIMTVVDGKWADGGADREQGFTHIGGGIAGNGGISDVNGAPLCELDANVVGMVRIYSRALLVSEAIGNWRSTTR
jgi:hypothetical protein